MCVCVYVREQKVQNMKRDNELLIIFTQKACPTSLQARLLLNMNVNQSHRQVYLS